MNKLFAIGFSDENQRAAATCLAERYQFILNNQCLPRLNLTEEKLELLMTGFLPLFVDFNQEKILKRQKESGKKQGLIQACKPQRNLSILDVTAGWGRDAAILANFGANVTMVERNPIMAALLEDGLKRLAAVDGSLSLIYMDAKDYLNQLLVYPDVIYIDPMHPVRQKSALVKKDMQILQNLIGPDMDANELLEIALQRVQKKVVVKWPQREPPLLKPHFSYAGKTVRFDVFYPNNSL